MNKSEMSLTDRAHTYIHTYIHTYDLSEKNEFIAIDIFRFIFAICVVALHLEPLKDINHYLSYFVENDLTRLAVPFFFLTSGFFIREKIYETSKVRKYILKLLQMYLIYSVIYLPQQVYGYMKNDKSLLYNTLQYIRDFFLVGSYTHLWYFIALIVATAILYLLVAKIKLSDRKIVIIAVTLYIIGTVFDAYSYPLVESLEKISFSEISNVGHNIVLWAYIKMFSTTRNGLFFGFPYVFCGYLIANYKGKIKRKNYFAWFFASFILMTLEALIAHNVFKNHGQNMLFMLLPTSVFMFLAICHIHCNNDAENLKMAKHFRCLSVLFFGLHLFINFYIKGVLRKGLDIGTHSLVRFLIVILINYVVAEMIIFISNRNKFHWLKKLY